MFFEGGENCVIEVFHFKKWVYRITDTTISSPITYIGNINTNQLVGEMFLYNEKEPIIIETKKQISFIHNEILNKDLKSSSTKGVILCHLDLSCIYEKISKEFIENTIQSAEFKLNLQINYKKKYEEEKLRNDKILKSMSNLQKALQNFNKEIDL
jgi:hypothetical protein